MYKKIKNYKSLLSKMKAKGTWHFNPNIKSKDVKYLGRIKLTTNIINEAIKASSFDIFYDKYINVI